jgi:PilZ domain
MSESRAAPRHRVLKAGTIEFGGGAIDCTIRNLSNAGAALDVTSPVGIPDRFMLVLPGDGLHMSCHVVWRKQRRLGVAFD